MKRFIAGTLFALAFVGGPLSAHFNAAGPATSKLTGAVPINPAGWATATDREDSGSDGEGVTKFSLMVSPMGAVEQCKIVVSSGFIILDQLTCSLMMSRGHFYPAKDQSGLPISSLYENTIAWVRPGHVLKASASPPYLSLTVKRLPDNVSSPTVIRVIVIVAPDGRIEACEGQGKDASMALNAVACGQVGPQVADLIARDQNGAPRRILRSLLVEFAAD